MRWLLMIITVSILLQGCAQPKQKELPVVDATPPKPAVMEAAPKAAVMDVVILVSDDIAAYSQVAQALAKHLGQRGIVRYLKGSQLENMKMLAAYKDDKHKQFVSIGLNASVTAKSLADSQVVFCQVFNYQDYGLLTDRHKGVSMVPISKTFGTWRALAPGITDIGVISGPGLEDMMQTAKSAAKKFGVTLHHKTVNSDKEYQFAYKEMADEVQGYWLLPDNRVLSGSMLSDVMTFSVRNSKQVAVFSEELLNLGGLFSITSDPQDIAQQVLERLEQAQKNETIPGADIAYLDKAVVRINSVMAQRLNLKIPKQYKKYENAS
jgi:ABC-type uncharacterized transport system substrate-binding protein